MNIIDKIYQYYEQKESTKEPSKEVTFAPSYFNDCHRKIFYKKTGKEQSDPISLPAFFKMDMGNAGHEKIQSVIEKLDGIEMIECEDMKSIDYKGLTFNYRIDGKIKAEDKTYILEIKTIFGYGWKVVEEAPKPEHVIQLYLYMHFENIENGIILYVDRGNGHMKQYDYAMADFNGKQDEYISNGIEQLKKLKEQIEHNEIPDRGYRACFKWDGEMIKEEFTKEKVKYKADWQCSYCSWKKECWKDIIEQMGNDKQFYINGGFE